MTSILTEANAMDPTALPAPRKVRLSLLDLLALVAATAPGLALARTIPDYEVVLEDVMICRQITQTARQGSQSGMGWSTTPGLKWFRSTGRPVKSRPSYWLGHLPIWSAPCLASWTLAAMALGLRGPRPSLRRLARRPGMAAGLALILALVVEAMKSLRFWTTSGTGLGSVKDGWGMYEILVLTSFSRLAGFSVAAWWLALALSGRWSAEVNGGGRLGRALGWCWIAVAVSGELGLWCFALNS